MSRGNKENGSKLLDRVLVPFTLLGLTAGFILLLLFFLSLLMSVLP